MSRTSFKGAFYARGHRIPMEYCEEQGKPCFDKRSAQTAANARYSRDHTKLRIYPHHDHWHLTSKV